MQENWKRILKLQILASEVCPYINLATYVNAENLGKELMSSFKVALKDVVSKLDWKFQITVLETCALWSSIQRFRAAMKQRPVRNIWSSFSDFKLQSDTSEHESQPSLRHKNEVKFYFVTFQRSSHWCTKELLLRKNSPVSFHQLSPHRKVEVDCPHTKLETSDESS